METVHQIYCTDARSLSELESNSVNLVVTSPPYPMIEMWDELFSTLNPAIGDALADGTGSRAFTLMHDELDAVWAELDRVLCEGGIVCINVGDATRTVGGQFRLYPNHAEIITRFHDHGFQSLPTIQWKKPTNMQTKFMGSGMLPPNAYVTLEHEHILIFRKGDSRSFAPRTDRRYESAYFWEERNHWFSDTWDDIVAENQSLADIPQSRSRAAAYPLTLPYRLINMFSVRSDVVLDPFWGTGTTTFAAMCAARESVGYEIDEGLVDAFSECVSDIPGESRRRVQERLDAHAEFVETTSCSYEATYYDTVVKTKQERDIRFYHVTDVETVDGGYRARHDPYSPPNSSSQNT